MTGTSYGASHGKLVVPVEPIRQSDPLLTCVARLRMDGPLPHTEAAQQCLREPSTFDVAGMGICSLMHRTARDAKALGCSSASSFRGGGRRLPRGGDETWSGRCGAPDTPISSSPYTFKKEGRPATEQEKAEWGLADGQKMHDDAEYKQVHGEWEKNHQVLKEAVRDTEEWKNWVKAKKEAEEYKKAPETEENKAKKIKAEFETQYWDKKVNETPQAKALVKHKELEPLPYEPLDNSKPAPDADELCIHIAETLMQCNDKRWNTHECRRLSARMNGCGDPEITDPAPDEPGMCGTPEVDAAHAERAALLICHRRVKFVRGHDPCAKVAAGEVHRFVASGPGGLCSDPAVRPDETQCTPFFAAAAFPARDVAAELRKARRRFGGPIVLVTLPEPPKGPHPPGPE